MKKLTLWLSLLAMVAMSSAAIAKPMVPIANGTMTFEVVKDGVTIPSDEGEKTYDTMTNGTVLTTGCDENGVPQVADFGTTTFFCLAAADGGPGTEEDAAVVTAYQEDSPNHYFNYPNFVGLGETNGVGELTSKQYLRLETGADIFYRLFNPIGTEEVGEDAGAHYEWKSIGEAPATNFPSSVYVDTLIQFTPCEDPQTLPAGAKFAVYAFATNTLSEMEGHEDDDPNATNLCVIAATVDASGNATPTTFVLEEPDTDNLRVKNPNYTVITNVDAAAWYRLTIVTAPITVKATSAVGFQVFLNGKRLRATAAKDAVTGGIEGDSEYAEGRRFVSAVLDAQLTAVGFQGTGALDAYYVTEMNPYAQQVKITLMWDSNISSFGVEYTKGGEPQQKLTISTDLSGVVHGENGTNSYPIADLQDQDTLKFSHDDMILANSDEFKWDETTPEAFQFDPNIVVRTLDEAQNPTGTFTVQGNDDGSLALCSIPKMFFKYEENQDEKEFHSLAEALAAVPSEATISMNNEMGSLAVHQPIVLVGDGKKVTLNLNGQKISAAVPMEYLIYATNCTLNIYGGTLENKYGGGVCAVGATVNFYADQRSSTFYVSNRVVNASALAGSPAATPSRIRFYQTENAISSGYGLFVSNICTDVGMPLFESTDGSSFVLSNGTYLAAGGPAVKLVNNLATDPDGFELAIAGTNTVINCGAPDPIAVSHTDPATTNYAGFVHAGTYNKPVESSLVAANRQCVELAANCYRVVQELGFNIVFQKGTGLDGQPEDAITNVTYVVKNSAGDEKASGSFACQEGPQKIVLNSGSWEKGDEVIITDSEYNYVRPRYTQVEWDFTIHGGYVEAHNDNTYTFTLNDLEAGQATLTVKGQPRGLKFNLTWDETSVQSVSVSTNDALAMAEWPKDGQELDVVGGDKITVIPTYKPGYGTDQWNGTNDFVNPTPNGENGYDLWMGEQNATSLRIEGKKIPCAFQVQKENANVTGFSYKIGDETEFRSGTFNVNIDNLLLDTNITIKATFADDYESHVDEWDIGGTDGAVTAHTPPTPETAQGVYTIHGTNGIVTIKAQPIPYFQLEGVVGGYDKTRFGDALATAAEQNKTITLDRTMPVRAMLTAKDVGSSEHPITIDLKGHSMTNAGDVAYLISLTNCSYVTFMNSGADTAMFTNSFGGVIELVNCSNVTFASTVKMGAKKICLNAVDSGFKIDGGRYESTDSDAVVVTSTKTEEAALPVIAINAGTFVAPNDKKAVKSVAEEGAIAAHNFVTDGAFSNRLADKYSNVTPVLVADGKVTRYVEAGGYYQPMVERTLTIIKDSYVTAVTTVVECVGAPWKTNELTSANTTITGLVEGDPVKVTAGYAKHYMSGTWTESSIDVVERGSSYTMKSDNGTVNVVSTLAQVGFSIGWDKHVASVSYTVTRDGDVLSEGIVPREIPVTSGTAGIQSISGVVEGDVITITAEYVANWKAGTWEYSACDETTERSEYTVTDQAGTVTVRAAKNEMSFKVNLSDGVDSVDYKVMRDNVTEPIASGTFTARNNEVHVTKDEETFLAVGDKVVLSNIQYNSDVWENLCTNKVNTTEDPVGTYVVEGNMGKVTYSLTKIQYFSYDGGESSTQGTEPTLGEALSKMNGKTGTITLARDMKIQAPITAGNVLAGTGGQITIDLGGNEITPASEGWDYLVRLTNCVNVVFKNGTLENPNGGGFELVDSTVTFGADNNKTLFVNVGAKAVAATEGGSVTVTNGTTFATTGQVPAIDLTNVSFEIAEGATVTSAGAAVAISQSEDPVLTLVKGGTFTCGSGDDAQVFAVSGAKQPSKFVQGGTFSKDIPVDYLSDNPCRVTRKIEESTKYEVVDAVWLTVTWNAQTTNVVLEVRNSDRQAKQVAGYASGNTVKVVEGEQFYVTELYTNGCVTATWVTNGVSQTTIDASGRRTFTVDGNVTCGSDVSVTIMAKWSPVSFTINWDEARIESVKYSVTRRGDTDKQDISDKTAVRGKNLGEEDVLEDGDTVKITPTWKTGYKDIEGQWSTEGNVTGNKSVGYTMVGENVESSVTIGNQIDTVQFYVATNDEGVASVKYSVTCDPALTADESNRFAVVSSALPKGTQETSLYSGEISIQRGQNVTLDVVYDSANWFTAAPWELKKNTMEVDCFEMVTTQKVFKVTQGGGAILIKTISLMNSSADVGTLIPAAPENPTEEQKEAADANARAIAGIASEGSGDLAKADRDTVVKVVEWIRGNTKPDGSMIMPADLNEIGTEDAKNDVTNQAVEVAYLFNVAPTAVLSTTGEAEGKKVAYSFGVAEVTLASGGDNAKNTITLKATVGDSKTEVDLKEANGYFWYATSDDLVTWAKVNPADIKQEAGTKTVTITADGKFIKSKLTVNPVTTDPTESGD